MKLRRSGRAGPFPVPVSVLLTVLWTGVVQLLLAIVTENRLTGAGYDGVAALWHYRLLGVVRLPTVLMAVNLLLILFLWLDYRSPRWRARRGSLAFLAAALLLVYLGWAVWRAWWSHVGIPPMPEGTLLAVWRGGG